MEPAGAEVDPVDLARPASDGEAGGHGEGPEQGTLASATGAEDRQVPISVGLEGHRRLGLLVGVIDDPEHQAVVASRRGQARQVVQRRQLGEPGQPRRLELGLLDRVPDGRDDALDVRGSEVRGGGRHRQGYLPQPGGAEAKGLDLHRVGRLFLRPPPDVRGLEGQELRGACPGHRSSRDAGVERRRHRGPEHVGAVGLVRHPKCQAQVGVGPQVVLDDAGGALGGEDQVEPEGAAPLGHVDHPIHELGHLLDQGGELVDDDHQAGRRLGITGALQLEQVLGPLAVEDPLAVPQLGGEGAQRASHQVRAQVGDQTRPYGAAARTR